MAKDRREFIGTYECMGGTTYAADYRWAILGEAEEVVRCRDCVWYAPLRCMCRRGDFTVLGGDGFCKWGERRDQTG